MTPLCKPFLVSVTAAVLVSSTTSVVWSQTSDGVYAVVANEMSDNKDSVVQIGQLKDMQQLKVSFDTIHYQPQLSIEWNNVATAKAFQYQPNAKAWKIVVKGEEIVKDSIVSAWKGGSWNIAHQYTYEEANRKLAALQPYSIKAKKQLKEGRQVEKLWNNLSNDWQNGITKPWSPYAVENLSILLDLKEGQIIFGHQEEVNFDVTNIRPLPGLYYAISEDKNNVNVTAYWYCDIEIKDVKLQSYTQVLSHWKKIGRTWKLIKLSLVNQK